jgi:hypothetical protein
VTIVTKKKEGAQTDATFKKEERAKDGAAAMLEYEAEARAIAERTARLRALRLAKEAAEKDTAAAQPIRPSAPKRQPARSVAPKRAARSAP